MTDVIKLPFGFTGKVNPLSRKSIQERLSYPKSPKGILIEWDHPYLIMLAENGTFPATQDEMIQGTKDFHEFLRKMEMNWRTLEDEHATKLFNESLTNTRLCRRM